MFPTVDACDASKVYPKGVRVRATLVMGIDPTGFAEEMLGGSRAPGVKGQMIGTAQHNDAFLGCRDRRGLPARTKRTGASASV